MTDTKKLKGLAERADALHGIPSIEHSVAITEFRDAANPQAILGLIQELEENEGVINVWRGRTQRAEAEVERLRKLEARQQEITEHYKKWFKEIVYESFDEWLKDDATHWIGEEDAALQAWQYLHENKIWLMKGRIEEQEQERARIKAENEALRKAFDEAKEMLARIGDFAHDKSTGPAVPDALWEISGMAYSAVRIDFDADLGGGER
ncbi:hypothetical protein [Pseudomonas citronellolis]|uniref:hypothetical protein n=1 Tax=Pseudomonas citronellolis TaxID=53408 RepID=UPI0007188B9D|nr:hypothetical protein [Pseudomonas citronellolis]KRV64197.1 hypothetical protein AO742_26500 [Pseudomonas citronellolis]KRW77493.1 hypothetical protein AO738_04475 [Pseudomonas citronellolis]